MDRAGDCRNVRRPDTLEALQRRLRAVREVSGSPRPVRHAALEPVGGERDVAQPIGSPTGKTGTGPAEIGTPTPRPEHDH